MLMRFHRKLMRFLHFIHEIKTIAYDVSDVNVFLPTLMRILPKKEVNFIPPILLLLFREFFALTKTISVYDASEIMEIK